MLHTHTHTRPEPGQPWKAKGRKKRAQTTGKRPEQRRGEGNERTSRTNLRGETHLTKTEHTPKPHDTLRRSTGEELGTEWGLVGDGRETTKTINLKRTQFQLHQVSCVTPLRDRSQVAPNCKNSYTNSTEFGAQYVQPHQTPSRERNHTCKHGPAFAVVGESS